MKEFEWKQYLKENGKIYGVKSVRTWDGWGYTGFIFETEELAQTWLDLVGNGWSEEYRELLPKEEALKLAGKWRFDEETVNENMAWFLMGLEGIEESAKLWKD